MKYFNVYIKSHCEAPDFETEFKANDYDEALDKLCNMLPYMDREYLSKCMAEDKESD